MDPDDRHVGSAIAHNHPFRALALPAPAAALSRETIDRWVAPFYMQILGGPLSEELGQQVLQCWSGMSEPLMQALLVDHNWRARIVGAWFAALKEQRSLTSLIGRLLLRSDLCYAGKGYCLALARFNTPESIELLLEYLNYYLTRIDLYYNQDCAMSAIAYLDHLNGTKILESMMPAWDGFIADKPYWQLDRSITSFEQKMTSLDAIAQRYRDQS